MIPFVLSGLLFGANFASAQDYETIEQDLGSGDPARLVKALDTLYNEIQHRSHGKEGDSWETVVQGARDYLEPFQDELLALAQNTNQPPPLIGIYVLGFTRPTANVEAALIKLSSYPQNSQMERMALTSLASQNTRSEKAHEAIVKHIRDTSDERTLETASEIAAKWGMTNALPIIVERMQSPNTAMKLSAAKGLQAFGDAARSTLPALREEASRLTDANAKRRIEKAIQTIEQSGASRQPVTPHAE